MPIITLQKKDREIGRIRMGQKVPTGNNDDKGNPVMRPEKLANFRLTSSNKGSLEAAAALYGGTVQHWREDQFELVTEVSELPVLVTDEPLSQWMESWSGPLCKRRCDGETNILNDTPCFCKQMKDAIADGELSAQEIKAFSECKATTRFNVRLPQLPDIGVWRLESHGWNSAKELASTVSLLQRCYRIGQIIPCLLGLELREVTRSKDDKPIKNKFYVPVLRVPMTLAAIVSQSGGLLDPVTGELTALPTYITGDALALPETGTQALAAPKVATPPAGRDAFGYMPTGWPLASSFIVDATEKQIESIKAEFEKRMLIEWSPEHLEIMGKLVLDGYGLDYERTKGSMAVLLDWLKNAPKESFDAALAATDAKIEEMIDVAAQAAREGGAE